MKAVEKKNKLLIFGFIGLATVSLIAFSPAIYAAIEPHITITMDSGQTTNPFVIKDDSNDDVFTIDTEGHISPEHEWRELKYTANSQFSWTNSSIFDTLPTDLTLNSQVLALWTIDVDNQDVDSDGVKDYWLANGFSFITGQMRSDHPTQDCVIFFEYYNSVRGWSGLRGIQSGTQNVWTAAFDEYFPDSIEDIEAVRLMYYADDFAENCDARNVDMVFQYYISDDWTLTRVK